LTDILQEILEARNFNYKFLYTLQLDVKKLLF